jgi:hypothetical protein
MYESYCVLRKNVKLKNCSPFITGTIGSASYPEDAKNYNDLFSMSDKTLYRGKMKGRNCFIIYLPEKHADINLKTQRDRIINPSYLHTKAFYSLTRSENITTGIREIINFLGDYYMIDHLCIDTGEGLYFNYYHKLCKRRDFKPFPKSVVRPTINPAMDLCMINYITEEESTTTKINNVLYKENITALLMCNISVYGVDYGIIRAEICSVGRGRIWQDDEKVVFLNLAHMIALILYYQNKKIEDL